MEDVVRVAAADEPAVSIVTVTARGPERLLRCLRAVAAEVPSGLPYEVVVVPTSFLTEDDPNNGSTGVLGSGAIGNAEGFSPGRVIRLGIRATF